MNRRDFLATGAGGALSSALHRPGGAASSEDERRRSGGPEGSRTIGGGAAILQDVRSLFPRLDHEIFLNAAAGTPLSAFAQHGLRQYEDFWRLGPGGGRSAAIGAMLDDTRAGLARLIGAQAHEIAFVQCTKQGEQIVLDGLPALRDGGNIVTNDLHFAGSLHNLVGLQRTGVDVRIVRSENWRTNVDAMAAAIDDATALVSVTLVSNVNGHIEPIREIADIAHAHGAHVYADIIQAAGIVPVDAPAMGIDFAAGNGYKWLFGPHGTGFLYVRQELQGTVLEDELFPGHVRHNYAPWVDEPDPGQPALPFAARTDAQRYQPGHVAYLCYAAVHEGLAFIDEVGVEDALAHSVALNQRLLAGLDAARYTCISPHVDRSPIITFRGPGRPRVAAALEASNVVVSLSPTEPQIRVSPAIFSNEDDIDALIDLLNGAYLNGS